MSGKENKPAKGTKKKVDTSVELVKSFLEIKDIPKEITSLLKDKDLKDLGQEEIEKLLKYLKQYMMKISSLLFNQRSSPNSGASADRNQQVNQADEENPSDEMITDDLEIPGDNANIDDDNMNSDDNANHFEYYRSTMSICISVVRWVVETWGSKEIKRSFSIPRIYTMFASFLVVDKLDFRLRNQMSTVCEKLIGHMVEEDCSRASLLVIVFVLDLTLHTSKGKCPTKADIKRVWSIRKSIGQFDLLDPVLENLLDKLLTVVVHKSYLNCKEGRQLIAFLMTLNEELVKRLYAKIIDHLPTLSKTLAGNYGDVLVTAWNNALPPVKKEIEDNCIQDLMRRIFTLSRNGLNFNMTGQIVFEILRQLHDSRKTYAFSSVITDLYTPLIWRYLRSGHPMERCNAAQVFMDVFPLEKTVSSFVEKVRFKERQFKEMMDLLLDDYHIVRIIAIKGVCHHLMSSLECFAVAEIKSLLKTLVDTLANDGSTYLVRQEVFVGLASMMKKKESAELLEPILPQIKDHIHDNNEKVRRAFILILQTIKESRDTTSLSYWDVVSIEHLAARLEVEGPVAGEPIVKLIMSNFYVEDVALEKCVGRIIRLVHMNAKAARKLFQYSYKLLTVKDVHKIVIGILGHLRRKAKEFLEETKKEYNENDSAKEVQTGRRKRKKNQSVLSDVSNANIEEQDKSSSSSNESRVSTPPAPIINKSHDPVLNRGLLECAGMLWSVFSEKLNLPENNSFLTDLYTLACNTIPLFLRAYKDTEMYYATVYFASLVPLWKLNPFSTISGACMSELKSINNTTSPNQTHCLVYSLCAWNRGSEIIELALDWLDSGFRLQHLNKSQYDEEAKRARKVRFELGRGKPLLAVKLLDAIFCDFINEKRLANKSYESLLELYVYLRRIKDLVGMRVERDKPFHQVELSDDFALRLFKRYLLLPHTLHRNEKPPELASAAENEQLKSVKASEEITMFIKWAENDLLKYLPTSVKPAEEKPFVVKCLLEIMKSANSAILLNMADKLTCEIVATFAIKLLSSGSSIWFVEDCLSTVIAFSSHAEAYTFKDDWGLLLEITPPLYRKCLDCFVSTMVDKENISIFFSNKGIKLRSGLVSYLAVLNRLYGKKCNQFIETFNMLMDCCINVTLNKLLLDDEDRSGSLADQPFMVGLIVKILFSNATFIARVLPSFQLFFKQYKQDGNLLAACVSLLDSVVRSHLAKLNRTLLEALMKEAYATLMAYKKSIASDNTMANSSRAANLNESSFCSTHTNEDPVKFAESILVDLGKFSCCALMPSVINNNAGLM